MQKFSQSDIARIWSNEPNIQGESQTNTVRRAKQLAKNIKNQLIDDLLKQHEELHKMKLNICISLDKQKKAIRRQIKILRADIG